MFIFNLLVTGPKQLGLHLRDANEVAIKRRIGMFDARVDFSFLQNSLILMKGQEIILACLPHVYSIEDVGKNRFTGRRGTANVYFSVHYELSLQ